MDAIAKHYEEVRNHIPKDLAPDDVIFTGKTLYVFANDDLCLPDCVCCPCVVCQVDCITIMAMGREDVAVFFYMLFLSSSVTRSDLCEGESRIIFCRIIYLSWRPDFQIVASQQLLVIQLTLVYIVGCDSRED